ncbi:hypothetical protein BHE74_00050854, partial [Ensete ventricosum]
GGSTWLGSPIGTTPTSTGLEEASLEGTVPTHRGDRPLVGAAIPGALRCRLRRGSANVFHDVVMGNHDAWRYANTHIDHIVSDWAH